MRHFARLSGILLGAAACVVGGSVSAEERAVHLGAGDHALHGVYSAMTERPARPAVLMLAGSGTPDRNGNALPALHTDAFRMMARAFDRANISSLRVDKRGAGESLLAAPPEAELTIDVYADDARNWIRWLAGQSGVSCVVVVGHSEGATIAVMVGEEPGVCGVVLISGPGRPIDEVLLSQLQARGAPPPVLARVQEVLRNIAAGEVVDQPPPALSSLLRPSVQPYLRSEMQLDPVALLRKVAAPALVVQGTTDLQITEADAERLARARPGVELKVIPGMNHVMKSAPADMAANLATYANPQLPLAPGLMDAVVTFVKSPAVAGRSAHVATHEGPRVTEH